MQKYRIQAPNGITYELEGPDGASQQEVIAAVLRQNPEAEQAVPADPGFLKTVSTNFMGGLKSGLLGAGAAAADYTGFEDTAASLDARRAAIQEEMAQTGGGTSVGRIAGMVGGLAPAAAEVIASPFTGGSTLIPLAVNAGLFALPGFRDTYKAQKAKGASTEVAVEHAVADAGLMLVGGQLLSKAGAAVKVGEKILPQMGKAAAEGAAFDVANTSMNKGIDVANDVQNDAPWIDPTSMAENAAAFGILRSGTHVLETPQRAARARAVAADADYAARAEAHMQQLEAEKQEGLHKQTSEYAADIEKQYTDAEQAFAAKRAELKTVTKDSPTYAADTAHNQSITAQLKDLGKARAALAPEFNRVTSLRAKAQAAQDAETAAATAVPVAPAQSTEAAQNAMEIAAAAGQPTAAAPIDNAAPGDQGTLFNVMAPGVDMKAPERGRAVPEEPRKILSTAADGTPIYAPAAPAPKQEFAPDGSPIAPPAAPDFLSQQREAAQQQVRALAEYKQTLQKQAETAWKAGDDAAHAGALAQYGKVSAAHDAAVEAASALDAAATNEQKKSDARKPDLQLAAAIKAMGVAVEQGDMQLQGQLRKKIADLKALGAVVPPAQDISGLYKKQERIPAGHRTTAGSESTADFRKRVPGTTSADTTSADTTPADTTSAKEPRMFPATRTEQGRLFDAEHTGGSALVAGAGGSEKTMPELYADLQIARATSNKPAIADAIERLRDAKESALKEKSAPSTLTPFDVGAANLADVVGAGRQPTNVKALQAASAQRNIAYGQLVSLLDRFNRGKARQDEVDAAVKNVQDGLVGEINAGRTTPMSDTQEHSVRRAAYTLNLLDLIERFGDTRASYNKGTRKDPYPILAQRSDGSWGSAANPLHAPGYPTVELAAPGNRTFGSPHAAVLAVKEGLDNIRNSAISPGTMERRDTSITPETTSVEALNSAIENARATTPEQQTLLERIKDELPVIASAKPVHETRTGTVQGVGPERGPLQASMNVAMTETARGIRPADDVAAWLHSLRIGRESVDARDAVIAHLARMELGKRSETEDSTRTRQTAFGKARGEEKPVRRAEQADLFDQSGTASERGTVFRTSEEFFRHLAGEGLHIARSMLGITTPSLHYALRTIEPLQKRIDALSKQMSDLQTTYAAHTADIKAQHAKQLAVAQEDSEQAQRLVSQNQMLLQDAEAVHAQALAPFEKLQAELSKELVPARVRLQNAHEAFAQALGVREKLRQDIIANLNKFGRISEEGRTLLNTLLRRQGNIRVAMEQDVSHGAYTMLRKLQREAADVTDRLAVHELGFPDAARAFFEQDARLQRPLIDATDTLHEAHTLLEDADAGLQRLQKDHASWSATTAMDLAEAKRGVKHHAEELATARTLKEEADTAVAAHEESIRRSGIGHSSDEAGRLIALSADKQALEEEKYNKLYGETQAQTQARERAERAQTGTPTKNASGEITSLAPNTHIEPIPEGPVAILKARQRIQSAETHGGAEARSNAATAEHNAYLERLEKMPTMQVTFEALRDARSSIDETRKADILAAMGELEPSDASYKKYQTELNKIERAERYLADRDGGPKNADRLKMEEENQRLLQKTIPAALESIPEMPVGKARTAAVKRLAVDKRRAAFLKKILADRAGVQERVRTPEERRAAAEDYLANAHKEAIEERGTTQGEAPIYDEEGNLTNPDTVALKPGRVSQASKKELLAGDQRTGSEESRGLRKDTGERSSGENKLGSRNPVQEQRRVTERNTAVSAAEQREANTAAEAAKPDRPQDATLVAEARAAIADAKIADLNRKIFEAKEKETAYGRLPPARQVAATRTRLLEDREALERELSGARTDAKRAHAEAETAARKGADEPTEAAEVPVAPTKNVVKQKKKVHAAPTKTVVKQKRKTQSDPSRESAAKALDAGVDSATAWIAENLGGTPESTHVLHGATFAEAADWAIKRAGDPVEKALLEHMRAFLAVADSRGGHGRVYVFNSPEALDEGGLYANNPDFVKVNLGRGEESLRQVLMHELAHAATVVGMRDNAMFNARVEGFVDTALDWVLSPAGEKYALRQENFAQLAYGLSNSREFIAEVYSNPAFQRLLQQIPSTTPKTSLWTKVLNAVAGLFKVSPKAVNTLFGDAAAAAEEAMQLTKTFRENGSATASAPIVSKFTYHDSEVRYANNDLKEAGAVLDKFVARHKPWYTKVRENATGLAFETSVIDRFAPLERLSKTMDPLKGMQMMYDLRMYDQRMHFVALAAGNGVIQNVEKIRSDGRKEYILESVKGANLNHMAQTLAKSGAGSPDAANRLFTGYLAAHRVERHGIESLNMEGTVTKADLAKLMQAIRATPGMEQNFQIVRDEYNQYNRDLIDLLQSTGAISKDMADSLKANNDYIPFYREEQGVARLYISGEHPINIGSIAEQPYLHELVGGNKPIVDFLTSSVQNTNILTDMALRNLATKNVVMELVDMDMAKISNNGNISGPTVVKFKVDGMQRAAFIDTDKAGIPADLLVKGMEGIPTQMPLLFRMMSAPSRLLRKAVTISPLYSARQVIRDSLAAPILAGADFTPIMGAIRQIGSAHNSTLENRGITGGQQFSGTPEDISKILRDITSGKGAWDSALSKLESIGMKADALTRNAQYESYRKQGLSEMEGSLMSLESMNFTKRGASPSMHVVNALIPFFNAQVQALNVLYKSVTGQMPMNERLKIQEKLLQRGLMLAAGSMAYAMLMQDDEAYKNASPEDRANNWFVRVPGVDEPLRIPVPFEVGYIFKALPEALLNTLNGKHADEDAKKVLGFIAKQMIPGAGSYGIPQAMKPAIEVGLNRSFFTGRDIVNTKEQRLLPEYQFRDNTTEISKMLGGAAGVSPIKIDALVNGYTGAMGLAFMQVAGMGLATEGPATPTKRMSDRSLIGGAFQKNDAGAIIDDMYTHMQRAEQVKASFDALVAKGNKSEARALLQNPENAFDYGLSGVASAFVAKMSGYKKMEDMVRAATQMTPDQKRLKLDQIQAAKTEYAAKARSAGDEAKTKFMDHRE